MFLSDFNIKRPVAAIVGQPGSVATTFGAPRTMHELRLTFSK